MGNCFSMILFLKHTYLKLRSKIMNLLLHFYISSQIKPPIYLHFKINFQSGIKLFIYAPSGVLQCVCIQPHHLINLNTRTWQHSIGFMLEIKFSDRIILFQIEIEFSNFKTRFEISNKFKWIFKR